MQVTVNAYLGAPLTEVPPAILDLCRQLVDRSAEFEQQRYVSADYARHMARENLFRMFVPKSLGGPEMSLPVGLSCLETLGQYDGAIAWISMIGTTSALAASYLPPDLARTIFAGTGEADGAIYGGIFAPNGRAHPCALGDGFRLSGRWSWASGSANADWMILGGLLGPVQIRQLASACFGFLPFRALTLYYTIRGTPLVCAPPHRAISRLRTR